jgi:outer membrane lipoprotein-sorting protein
VSLKGPALRGRARALVAFSRPDALRLELPGPTGARCLAVARGEHVVAVFPAGRAVWEGAATASGMEALLGVRLSPAALMDLLVGSPKEGVSDYRAAWGDLLPRRVEATLGDGTRIEVVVESADLDPQLPAAAFEPPRSDGYRTVDAAEARRLLGIR